MIKVGISMRETCEESYLERRDAIAQDWILRLAPFNVLPIFIPNNLDNVRVFIEKMEISHLLLTGGNSIGDEASLHQLFNQCQQFSNEHNIISTFEQLSLRDITEVISLHYAMENHLPVFAVCRGLQLINVCFGGNISRKVFGKHSLQEKNNAVHHVASTHAIDWRPTGEKLIVNSYHEDAAFQQQLAPQLTCLASSEDGVVEALCNQSESVIAVQWHPERDGSDKNFDSKLIDTWLNQ